jgi:hypothetical protein
MAFAQFQFRRDTAANWTAANPILAEGEIGLELDTDQFKIGDGVTAWTSLAYGGLQGPAGADGAPGADGADGADGAETPLNPAVFPHISTPSDPGAGNTSLYAKTDGKLYYLPTGGSETEVGSGSVGGREQLTANRTYYVRTDGNDSNDGLTDSAGGAFLTIQKAVDTVSALDISIYTATITITGTFTEAVVLRSLVGSGKAVLSGGTLQDNHLIKGNYTGTWEINGVTLNAGSGNNAIDISGGTLIVDGCIFGTGNVHIFSGGSANVLLKSYTINGGGYGHYYAYSNGRIQRFDPSVPATVTLTGTPAFTIFAIASRGGIIDLNPYANSFVFSGSATGQRYLAESTGIIQSSTGGSNYYPGSTPGSVTTSTYGIYVG